MQRLVGPTLEHWVLVGVNALNKKEREGVGGHQGGCIKGGAVAVCCGGVLLIRAPATKMLVLESII
jgi:hypothetical protein